MVVVVEEGGGEVEEEEEEKKKLRHVTFLLLLNNVQFFPKGHPVSENPANHWTWNASCNPFIGSCLQKTKPKGTKKKEEEAENLFFFFL